MAETSIWDILGFAYGVYNDQNPKAPRQTPIQMSPEQKALFDRYLGSVDRYTNTAAGTGDYITNVINKMGQSGFGNPTFKSEYMKDQKVPTPGFAGQQLFGGMGDGQRPFSTTPPPQQRGGGGGGPRGFNRDMDNFSGVDDGFSVEGSGRVGGGYNPFGPSLYDYFSDNPGVPSWAVQEQNDRNKPGGNGAFTGVDWDPNTGAYSYKNPLTGQTVNLSQEQATQLFGAESAFRQQFGDAYQYLSNSGLNSGAALAIGLFTGNWLPMAGVLGEAYKYNSAQGQQPGWSVQGAMDWLKRTFGGGK